MSKINKQVRFHFKRERWIVLIHYGGNPPKCACCGETFYEFLAIDHINGGGNQQLKQMGGSRRAFYHWIIKNNFPEGFRVLCHNCNCAKGFYGYCPHETGKTEQIPNDIQLIIKTPNNWVGSPSENRKGTTFFTTHNKKTTICKNCGGEFLNNGTHISFAGFCSKECNDEWREREKIKLKNSYT